MRAGRPSTTAAIVSFGRGVGLSDSSRDLRARSLLPKPLSIGLAVLDGAGPAAPLLRMAARVASAGLVDHVSLRMAAVDDAVSGAAAAGCTQLVVLGAGLDARPWRMPALSESRVLEIDHPATQAYKRARTRGRAPLCREHRFVPVDFERGELGRQLDHHLDPELPTHWLWEAVTMYLKPRAIEDTLAIIAARSAPSSALTLTYATPRYVPLGKLSTAVVRSSFALLGEPLVGTMASPELARRLERHGFGLVEDTDSATWASRYGTNRIFASAFRAERLAIAARLDRG